MGQNFLLDESVAERMVEIAQVKKDDLVLEVGPGMGVLTKYLLDKNAQVVAVEKDKRFVDVLRNDLFDHMKLKVIGADILSFDINKNLGGRFKVVANIPYYLTGKLVQNLLALKYKPETIVVMLQKEVAERIVAGPGKMSLLSLSVQFYAEAGIELSVPKEYFWPMPKVDSAVVKINPNKKHPEVKNEKLFFRLAKTAFAGKRKQIHNTLRLGFVNEDDLKNVFLKTGMKGTERPQDLSVEDWIKFYSATEKFFKQ
jgi:16S rRNA (adenine1518-N6/adenine1519-N6)-dimethyltransferase